MGSYMPTRRFQKLWQARTTRIVALVLAAAFFIATFQTSMVIFGDGAAETPSPLASMFGLRNGTRRSYPNVGTDSGRLSPTPAGSLPGGSSNRTEEAAPHAGAAAAGVGDAGNEAEGGEDSGLDDDGEEDEDMRDGFFSDIGDGTVVRKAKDGHIVVQKVMGRAGNKTNPRDANHSAGILRPQQSTLPVSAPLVSTLPPPPPPQSSQPPPSYAVAKERKKEKFQGVWSIADMDRELLRNRASPETMIPRWPSPLDQQLLDARHQIENAPAATNDRELYAPVFRNVSMFRRSYELMEQILKVYIYKEGERPIFHTPFFTGIYASEGWFMKHMQENTQFVVDDPGKAHLFYIPVSPRTLQERLYIANSHSHDNLIEYYRKYVGTIAAKYPFWNRTGGADHFVVGSHDWATHETGKSMPTTIRALANADVRLGFELGKDVSLPTTNVRCKDDPIRGLGGKPARKRTTLAFYAGNMHGYLRPILLQHWENKDPSMKIFGPFPHYGAMTVRKNNKNKKINIYVDYMKDSKYCICPKGYEVNSPRVMEAIFYECVPVIISDNYVPPLFEVLNWAAFSVVLPEKDVPRLKDILESIPQRKYLRLLMGVKRVQRHFLWNKTPVKYDLFHMVLHSVWFNRVYQLRTG